jgi:hypothetical protein
MSSRTSNAPSRGPGRPVGEQAPESRGTPSYRLPPTRRARRWVALAFVGGIAIGFLITLLYLLFRG